MEKIPKSYPTAEPISTSCCAISIKNSTQNKITYFYANLSNKGQTRWYPHDIASSLWTWDWIWSNFDTGNCLEIKIPLSKNKFVFVVLVYKGTGNEGIGVSGEFAKCDVCWTYTNEDKNPDWTKDIWNICEGKIFNLDLINYHGAIDIRDDSINLFYDGFGGFSINYEE
ncbi:MAG: hypothetical protein ACRDCG_02760 [Mycoplasmoidaceae bacterium]